MRIAAFTLSSICLLPATSGAATAVAAPAATPAAAPAAAPVSPTAYVQSQAATVIGIINTPARQGSPAARERVEKLKGAVRGFMSFQLLADRTLGDHLKARTPAERAEFLGLLTQLIETSYAKSLGRVEVKPSDYTVAYTGERLRGERATVTGSVKVRSDAHDVELKLQRSGQGWLVLDIVTDEVSLAESYSESFDRIIKRDGWPALMTRMKDKLAKLRN